QWFSGRGAYIHVGALIGTIMTGNVFFNIMPNQRKMVAAVADKKDIDPAWGASAKLRSVHNNYFTLPLLFIMISNHYPMTYQHPQNWLVLIAIMAAAAWIRHFFNLRHVGTTKPSILVSGAVAMLAIALWVSWPQASSIQPLSHNDALPSSTMNAKSSAQPDLSAPTSEVENETSTVVSNETVASLITTHCVSCHSRTPTDEIFKVAPLGVVLDSWADIERFAPQLVRRTTVTKDMPFLNKTKMTEEERQVIARWFAQQQ
ncbi:MAG: urate hydroxylase PuuD, partial [Pseudomonadota bacterium]|nr:urate hydroxylase PuuD [Pseudomonadota bacterium]